jgi:hypothetical protein
MNEFLRLFSYILWAVGGVRGGVGAVAPRSKVKVAANWQKNKYLNLKNSIFSSVQF